MFDFTMGSLVAERNILEEGISTIKNAKLECANQVSEMYGALQRQYAQVRTIKLQGKAQDYVKKVLHDSKFFCILTKLITQAISQSRTLKQQTTNINRAHKWYISNLHKLHFAEQPAFRLHDSDEDLSRPVSVTTSQAPSARTPQSSCQMSSRNQQSSGSNITDRTQLATSPDSADKSQPVPSSGPPGKRTESESESNRPVSRSSSKGARPASSIRLSRERKRPKSVTWHASHDESRPDEEESMCEELWEPETENKSDTASNPSSPTSRKRRFDVVHSLAERRTPDYHLVDDSSYIDTVSKTNEMSAGHNSPAGRSFTPVVYEYIEQIQREVNKVQGHPSDLYPELFTPHIVSALIDENEDLKPMKPLSSTDVGRDLRHETTEKFFQMAEKYRPKSVKRFSTLQPRKDNRPRPKSSLPLANSRSSVQPVEPKSLHLKDVVSLIDFASAEISYAKEAGLRSILNRPKDLPLSLHSAPKQLEIEPAPHMMEAEVPVDRILPRESAGSPTPSQSLSSVVDWRGRVTPTCSDSQQDIFRSHSYAKVSAKGRTVGRTSGGYRPRTASASLYARQKSGEEKTTNERNLQSASTPRVPQSASNTLVEIDKGTTKALLNITNMKTSSPRRHKSASSTELRGGYTDFLPTGYYVPPSSIYEYDSYPYELEPIPKSFPFMEEDEREEDSTSPRNVEYFSIVQSIGPDIDRIRAQSKYDMRVERLNTPASSATKEGSPPVAESVTSDSRGDDSQAQPAESETAAVNEPNIPQTTQLMEIKSLVPSPMFQYSSNPTAKGGMVRTRSPQGRVNAGTKDVQTEVAVTSINFEPPFDMDNIVKDKPKSAGRLKSSIDKSEALVRPIRSAPSIPSMNNEYGSRSPKLSRSHPFSGEHDRSAHRQLNPQEYLKRVQGMREEDIIVEASVEEPTEDITSYLDVRPMSSRRDMMYPDLSMSVHNAIKFERPCIEIPEQRLYSSPAFMTESQGTTEGSPVHERPATGRPKSSKSIASPRPLSSRPIPQYMKAEPWEKVHADTERQREAAAAVSIQKIFRGYVSRKVYLNLQRDYRTEQEDKRLSAVRIQRSWRRHRAKLADIYNENSRMEASHQRAKELKITQQQHKLDREQKRESENTQIRQQERTSRAKLSVIGPHVEVYSAYHSPKSGVTKQEMERAATKIQKIVRGRQCRNYINMIKEKAKWHAASWSEWVNYYKQFLRKILRRQGIEKPSIEIHLEQMQKFMAQKKRYEGVFERRAFGGELEEEEFVHFFKECDLMPANHEIEHAMDLVFKGTPRGKRTTLKKREVLDIVFEVYKPEGTGIINDRKSTWLHPIVDGEDAMKLLGTDMIEPTPLRPCLQLVANSMRERKEREEEEERLRLLAAQAANKKTLSPASGSPRSDNGSVNRDSKSNTSKTASNGGTTKIIKDEQNSQPAAKMFSDEPMVKPDTR